MNRHGLVAQATPTTRGVRLAAATTAWLFVAVTPLRFARAEAASAEKAMATELFREGRTLLDQGRIPEACAKLEESQRLDPGGGTLLNVALCHERQGRTAAAWEEFTEGLGIAKRDNNAQRIEFARTHIAQLEPALSRLVVEVPPAADLPDLEVRCDGNVVVRAAWGSPVPIDPGPHLVEAVAPGRVRWKQSVFVGPSADSKTAIVPVLEEAPVALEAPAVRPLAPPPKPSTNEAPRPSSPSRAPAWVLLGVSVVAAGAGTYFGIQAIHDKRDADQSCPKNVCSAQGESQNTQAIRFANFATAGLAVAGGGLGLATVLFLVYSASSSAAPAAPEGTETGRGSSPWGPIAGADISGRPGGVELRFSGRW